MCWCWQQTLPEAGFWKTGRRACCLPTCLSSNFLSAGSYCAIVEMCVARSLRRCQMQPQRPGWPWVTKRDGLSCSAVGTCLSSTATSCLLWDLDAMMSGSIDGAWWSCRLPAVGHWSRARSGDRFAGGGSSECFDCSWKFGTPKRVHFVIYHGHSCDSNCVQASRCCLLSAGLHHHDNLSSSPLPWMASN